MSRPMNWEAQNRRNREKSAMGRSLRASREIEYRRRQVGAEPEPEPHGVDFTDSRGRPISLPKISILERDEV